MPPSVIVHNHPTQRLSTIGTLSLVTLIIQNAAVALITRQSRMGITSENKRYHTSTVILNNEILKMVLCLIFFWFERKCTSFPQYWQNLSTAVFQPDTWKLSVPAALFTLQNFLIFLSLANLDVMTFQMLSQTKLLSAAIFSVWILHRRLNSTQWLSLIILTLGVILAHVNSSSSSSSSTSTSSQVPQHQNIENNFVSKHLPESVVKSLKKISNSFSHHTNQQQVTTTSISSGKNSHNNHHDDDDGVVNFSWIGVMACIISGLSSSFAGVYFEKVVKTSAPSLAVRNIHLSLFGIPFAIFSMFVLDVWKEGITNFNFFQGYSPIVWMLVFTHAVGGLLVAAVVKYADNILKGFATALATVLSGVYAAVVWQYFPTFEFVIGCVAVFGSVILFHYAENSNNSSKASKEQTSNNTTNSSNNNDHHHHSTSLLSSLKSHQSPDETYFETTNSNNNSGNNNILDENDTTSYRKHSGMVPTTSNTNNNNEPNNNNVTTSSTNSRNSMFQFHHGRKESPPNIKIGK